MKHTPPSSPPPNPKTLKSLRSLKSPNIRQRQEAILHDFSKYSNWEARYRYIIDLGKTLSPMEDDLKNENNKVQGCQSQVWIAAQLNDKKQLEFMADSDALIVKGLVSLILKVYSPSTCDEILENPPEFIPQLDLNNHLSPSRTNGVYSIMKKINHYALAYRTLLQMKVDEGK